MCSVHLNCISGVSHKIYDQTSWLSEIDYVQGVPVGGKICLEKVIYGGCMVIPLLLNWLYVLKVWIKDYRSQKTTAATAIFGITLTYPMVQVMRYLSLWKDEPRMMEEKERFERDVATLEGFLESILQVGNCFEHFICVIF